MESKEIILNGTRGGKAIISEEDYERVSKYSWSQTKTGYAIGYVDGKSWLMHRFIMNPDAIDEVDHINKIRLDNTRKNLRVTSSQKNNENKGKQSNTSSKFLGVYYYKSTKKYGARVAFNRKRHYVGFSDDQIKTAEIRDAFIVKNKLDHIQLNFPNKKEDYLKDTSIINVKQKSSSFYGVRKYYNKYIASIIINGKEVCICRLKNEQDAANKYDKYVVTNKIINKNLNFPEKYPNYNKNIRYIVKTLCENMDNLTVKLLINDGDTRCVKIDKEDYDKIKYYTCYINTDGYVLVSAENNKSIRLHRFIMNVTDPTIYIDHIDSDKLNNTKKNLRHSNSNLNSKIGKKQTIRLPQNLLVYIIVMIVINGKELL